MSNTLNTGALGLIGGRMKLRAEDGTADDEDDVTGAGTDDETQAEGDLPEEEAEGDEPEPPAQGDEPDDDETMSAADRRSFAQGRRAERARMAAILGSEAAEANPPLAAHLAFNTAMAADDALAALKAGGVPKAKGNLRSRVQGAAGQTPLGNGGKTGADAPSSSDRRAAARAGYLTGLSNRKRKEG